VVLLVKGGRRQNFPYRFIRNRLMWNVYIYYVQGRYSNDATNRTGDIVTFSLCSIILL
jgi:hypothetical protein